MNVKCEVCGVEITNENSHAGNSKLCKACQAMALGITVDQLDEANRKYSTKHVRREAFE